MHAGQVVKGEFVRRNKTAENKTLFSTRTQSHVLSATFCVENA